jgi:hypothetical protein
MPKLSLFTPVGLLRCSSAPSDAKRIFDARVKALGGDGNNFALGADTKLGAHIYAESIMEALARAKLKRAGQQDTAERIYDLIADREAEYGITPGAGESVADRKKVLAPRMLLPGGAGLINVENALRALLGDDFIAVRATQAAERVAAPPAIGDQPMNLQTPDVPRHIIRLVTAITTGLGSPQAVQYQMVDDSSAFFHVPIAFCVEPEAPGQTETVVVTARDVETGIVATFNKTHAAGAIATSQPMPIWQSNQRDCLVVLTPSAAADPEKRRQTHDLMGRLARGVSTWSIVAGDGSPLMAGPFIIESSPLNATPFGAVMA